MDFKALRKQILANIDHYSNDETKIVVTKLLDFLVDMSEKRSQLEEENKALFAEMNALKNKNQKQSFVDDEYKTKLVDVLKKANDEGHKIIDQAKEEASAIIEDAKKEAQAITDEANDSYNEIIETSLEKIKAIIDDIKKKDEEATLYRKHILSIFRKTIFRFSDTNYYIIRSDNQDFRDLLHFFEVDEKLQKLCDENIKKLEKDPKYLELITMLNKQPLEEDIVDVSNILKDEKVTIDNKTIELKEFKKKEVDNILIEEEKEDEKEEPITKSKFLDVINQYKNNEND